MLFYPTAIGSEPDEPEVDSKDHWQRCMQGHAAANIMPVIAANRIGSETICSSTIDFYGSSFITDSVGKIIAEADRTSEMIITAEFDLEAIEEQRISWTVFRDRRPSYKPLSVMMGSEIPQARSSGTVPNLRTISS